MIFFLPNWVIWKKVIIMIKKRFKLNKTGISYHQKFVSEDKDDFS